MTKSPPQPSQKKGLKERLKCLQKRQPQRHHVWAAQKKFTTKCTSILCTVCGLWIHKGCAGLTDELFEFLDKQFQATGMAYWACKPCTVYARGMNHRMRGIEEDIKEVKKTVGQNSAEIKKVEEQVNQLRGEIKKHDNVVTREEFEAYKKELSCESKERKAREMNLILHGVKENNQEGASGRDRWDWDVHTCQNIFQALKLKLTADDIKFCRRVGEKGTNPRPLVMGMFNMRSRSQLLSQDLRDTEFFSDVTIRPDLTKLQRKEEADIKREMDTLNGQLSEEDVSKNLSWRMVGQRGERRLVKGVVRGRGEGESAVESTAGGALLPSTQRRGTGQWRPRGG